MGKPSESELKRAIEKAAELREQGKDEDFIAKSLLSLNYRYHEWQKVVSALKRYLHSGMSTTEHAKLLKALKEAEAAEEKHDVDFGLD